jgi:asparagine synthase (glutamine-hydrolysing)
LLANPEVPRQVNAEAIDFCLSWGYIPAPDTAFRDIRKLPPGHWLTWEVEDGRSRLRVERYWELQYGPKLQISEAEAAEALREKLTQAFACE